VTISITK